MSDYCKSLKCHLDDILHKKKDFYDTFIDSISRSNNVQFVCSNFVRHYILHCFESNIEIPNLTHNFLKMAFKALSKSSCGPKPKDTQLIIYNNLCAYFEKYFIKILCPNVIIKDIKNINDYKSDSSNLSYILDCLCIEMETSYENNIKMNFFKYVHQYVNECFIKKTFKKLNKNEFKQLSKNEQTKYCIEKNEFLKYVKQIKTEIFPIKLDLVNNTLDCDKKYHKWINDNKKIIFPKMEDGISSYEQDIKINHHKYLKCMLNMNKLLESKNKKLFQCIPFRTSLTDQYVTFNTRSLEDIFLHGTSNKSNDEIWKDCFNINFKKMSIKGHSFNHQISTDGFAVSINFIKDDKIEGKQKKKENFAKALKESKDNRKNKTPEQIAKINKEKEVKKLEKKKQSQILKKEMSKKKKEEFKNLPKEEQDKIKLELKLKKNKCEYIEDAVKNPILLEELKKAYSKGKIVVGDPGARAPLTLLGMNINQQNMLDLNNVLNDFMLKNAYNENAIKTMNKMSNKDALNEVKSVKSNNINEKGKIRGNKFLYSYTTRRRIKETKRKKYNKLINNKKKKTLIKIVKKDKTKGENRLEDYEKKLNKYNSKTVDSKKFGEFIKLKIIMKNIINLEEPEPSDMTYNEYIKKLKWFAYINKKRHEDKLLNEIEKIFGIDAIFVIGDWSRKDGLKYISTPNVHMTNLLKTRFKVYLINEYNTSKLYHKTEKEGENLNIKITYTKEITNEEGKIIKETMTSTKKIHSILTFKTGKKSSECINRDYNAVLNMFKIIKSLLETKLRPTNYTYKPKQEKNLIAVKGVKSSSSIKLSA